MYMYTRGLEYTLIVLSQEIMSIILLVTFFFCQNWEDTEGRKKLSKVNARVSKTCFSFQFCN